MEGQWGLVAAAAVLASPLSGLLLRGLDSSEARGRGVSHVVHEWAKDGLDQSALCRCNCTCGCQDSTPPPSSWWTCILFLLIGVALGASLTAALSLCRRRPQAVGAGGGGAGKDFVPGKGFRGSSLSLKD